MIYGQSFTATVFMVDVTTGKPVTGDATNITLYLTKDGSVAICATGSGHPTEADATHLPGQYTILVTTAETQFGVVTIGGKSSTSANYVISPVTYAVNAPTLGTKYGSYTNTQLWELLVTSLIGVSSGLTTGSGSYSVKAPDGTAGTVTATIDANGNRTATSFTP